MYQQSHHNVHALTLIITTGKQSILTLIKTRRVRDLYATFEYEQQMQELKLQGKEPPPPPPNVLAALEATRSLNNTAADASVSGAEAPQESDAGQKGSETNPGPVVAPKIHEALQVRRSAEHRVICV